LNRLRNTRFAVPSIDQHEVFTRPVRVLANGKDGSLWVGADNGLYRFLGSEWRRYGPSDGVAGAAITALHSDIHNTLWVATEHGGVVRFDGKRFSPLPVPGLNELRRILALTVDDRGAVWLSDNDRGVFRLQEGRLIDLNLVPQIGRRLARFAHTDRAGRVWLGFFDGSLIVYEGDSFRLFTSNDGFINGNVTAFYEDRSGIVWIGTSSGLSRFDGSRFVHLTQKNGLPLLNVIAILEDRVGDLWLGVISGLVHLARSEVDKVAASSSHWVRHTFYDMSDGLRGVPMYLGAHPMVSSSDGTLWFVTSSGLAVVNPSTLDGKSLPPPVVIEDVIADGHVLDRSSAALPPRTSRVELGYTALTLAAPHKVRFRYRLDGFDADWVDAGNRRRTFYTNLEPGKYVFHVAASNDGMWGKSDATWAFSIAPAFYQTGWFYLASTMVLVLTLGAIWQLRLRHIRREFSLVVAERTRVGREIHDTLLQSLVGVALQFDELSSQIEATPRLAKEHVGRLREQVEFYIREARHSIWNLRSPTLDRRDLASALRERAESLVASTAIRLEFAVTGVSKPLSATVEEQLLRIGQEAVSNAVRHSHAREVRIELSYEHDSVRLRVVDDGCGFDRTQADQVGAHCGLLSMQERAAHIAARFTIESAPGQGTAIEIVGPPR
jgi:signal transduction histidine kinase